MVAGGGDADGAGEGDATTGLEDGDGEAGLGDGEGLGAVAPFLGMVHAGSEPPTSFVRVGQV